MEVNLKLELWGVDFVPTTADMWEVTNLGFTGGTVGLIPLQVFFNFMVQFYFMQFQQCGPSMGEG